MVTGCRSYVYGGLYDDSYWLSSLLDCAFSMLVILPGYLGQTVRQCFRFCYEIGVVHSLFILVPLLLLKHLSISAYVTSNQQSSCPCPPLHPCGTPFISPSLPFSFNFTATLFLSFIRSFIKSLQS